MVNGGEIRDGGGSQNMIRPHFWTRNPSRFDLLTAYSQPTWEKNKAVQMCAVIPLCTSITDRPQ